MYTSLGSRRTVSSYASLCVCRDKKKLNLTEIFTERVGVFTAAVRQLKYLHVRK